MMMDPGDFLVLMKSERATNNSLGIFTLAPLGDVAMYCGSASGSAETLLAGKAEGSPSGSFLLESWTALPGK
jgi:hypothetical protein